MTREEAIKILDIMQHKYVYNDFDADEFEALEMAIKALKQPKLGRWEDRYRSKWDGTRYWFRACSECDFERDDCNPEKDTTFCPNCGAKMDKEETECQEKKQ